MQKNYSSNKHTGISKSQLQRTCGSACTKYMWQTVTSVLFRNQNKGQEGEGEHVSFKNES